MPLRIVFCGTPAFAVPSLRLLIDQPDFQIVGVVTQPDRPRGFRVPWVPVLPILSVICCLVLMTSLPLETWLRFVVWLVIGLTIYFLYSRRHSEFARDAQPAAEPAGPRTPHDAAGK